MNPVAWAVQLPDGRIDRELVGTQHEVECWCGTDEGRAAGRRPAALFLSAPAEPDTPARWYVLGVHGDATVCTCQAGAARMALEYDRMFPRHGPHRAVRMAVVAEDAA